MNKIANEILKVPAENLKDVPFPDCHSQCKAAEYLGVGECENICGFKFDEENKIK